MAIPKEWLRHEQFGREVSAEDVRKMPAGTRVFLHAEDRYGRHQWVEATLVHSGKKKVLAFYTAFGLMTKEIRADKNKAYTVKD